MEFDQHLPMHQIDRCPFKELNRIHVILGYVYPFYGQLKELNRIQIGLGCAYPFYFKYLFV